MVTVLYIIERKICIKHSKHIISIDLLSNKKTYELSYFSGQNEI